MAKNKALIDQYKYVYKQTHQITPAIYASMAMALHRVYGFGFDRIDKVFSESQKIWESHNGNMDGMLEKCYEILIILSLSFIFKTLTPIVPRL